MSSSAESVGFEALIASAPIKDALRQLNITEPTPVQVAAIPAAELGADLIIQAKTGSGKTLAFVIPLLRILESHPPSDDTFGIIVTPTRELAVQIAATINSLNPGFKAACLIGGASISQQLRDLKEDHRIIVGTPGRLMDHLQQRAISLHNCGYFVLDEADEMLSEDFVEAITAILSRLPAKRQGLFVSATISPRVEELAKKFLTNPKQIIINSPAELLPSITHLYCEVSGDLSAKTTALCNILETENPKSAIIFCNTKSDTELIEKVLRRRGFDARCINSDLNQRERDYVMTKIRAQELRYLIGTDIASRGIDIEQIELVVNYSLPPQPEVYTHRTGRTGRAGRTGKAISIISPLDFSAFINIKREYSGLLEKYTLPEESVVAKARAEHFLSIMAGKDLNIQAREIAVGEELLRGLGVASASPELTNFMTKLYRYTLDHHLDFKSKSLEQEMAEISGAPALPQSSNRERPASHRRSQPSRFRGRRH